MPAYPALDILEVEERTGKGVAIVVEGQTYEDDAWFYGQWFGDRASQVTFFPQDGWPQVFAAVARLRADGCRVPVFGIVDRDFCDDNALDADFERCGVLRTPRFTIENYLLEPECWKRVFESRPSPKGRIQDGWDDLAALQTRIDDAFRRCLPLVACNWVLHFAQTRQQPDRALDLKYWEDPDALLKSDPARRLQDLGRKLTPPANLNALFEEKAAQLRAADLPTWHKYISGKHVINALHRQFPVPRWGQMKPNEYKYHYVMKCPHPPADLTALVDHILQAAGR